MATFKIAALQKALDDSVPLNDLEMANKQYNDLTAKYRDMLQKDNLLIQRTNNVEHLEVILFILYYFEQTILFPSFLHLLFELLENSIGCFIIIKN